MALGGKTSGEIHDKTGDDLAAMVAKYDASAHHTFIGFDEIDVMLHQMQLMYADIVELRRFVDSASELRGKISPLPVANGGTGLTASQPLIYAKISIDANEMAALATTRKTLVAAPGSNLIIVPVSIMIMCTKLNGTASNGTSSRLFAGYYNNDNRDLTRTPTHATSGLLHNERGAGSYNAPPVITIFQKEVLNVNKEFAVVLGVAPGNSGASASEVLFCYYIADVS